MIRGLDTPLSRLRAPVHVWYVALFTAAAVALMAALPIVAGDTDLWYHLNGGRYLADTGKIPNTSFFSFVSPPRERANYYWLFQLLVYEIHQHAGYWGLIVLRTVLFLLVLGTIQRLLFVPPSDTRRWYLVTVFVLCAVTLFPRSTVVRPHLFSYLFIPLCLLLLERQGRRLYWLPVVAAVWVNVHGVEYPVLLLLVCAYGLEHVVDAWRDGRRLDGSSLHVILPIFLAAATPYLTPHGLRLLEMPFIPTAPASSYIGELAPVNWLDLLRFDPLTAQWRPAYTAFRNLLLAGIAVAALRPFWGGTVRLSHRLLFVGGVVFLLRGQRFIYEFVLLALPLLEQSPLGLMPRAAFVPRGLRVAGLLCLAAAPFLSLQSFSEGRGRYPMSPSNLPIGVAAFVRQAGVQGTLLNHPNRGGYYQWALFPHVKIFADMEVPFLFTDEDAYEALNMYRSPALFQRVVARYHPSFVAVPLSETGFPALVKDTPQYVPVCFDDTEVLYVDAGQLPGLAGQWRLADLDPFTLATQPLDTVLAKIDADRLLGHLDRLLVFDPESATLNLLAAAVHNRRQQYHQALRHAERAIEGFPELAGGYRAKGEALKGLQRDAEAVAAYREAIARVGPAAALPLLYEAGLVELRAGQPRKAYATLKQAVNMFGPEAGYEQVFNLGLAAFRSGRTKEAEVIWRFGHKKAPLGSEWARKYEEQLRALRSSS